VPEKNASAFQFDEPERKTDTKGKATCSFVIVKGANKGLQCTLNAVKGSAFCCRHAKKEADADDKVVENEEASEQEKKVEAAKIAAPKKVEPVKMAGQEMIAKKEPVKELQAIFPKKEPVKEIEAAKTTVLKKEPVKEIEAAKTTVLKKVEAVKIAAPKKEPVKELETVKTTVLKKEPVKEVEAVKTTVLKKTEPAKITVPQKIVSVKMNGQEMMVKKVTEEPAKSASKGIETSPKRTVPSQLPSLLSRLKPTSDPNIFYDEETSFIFMREGSATNFVVTGKMNESKKIEKVTNADREKIESFGFKHQLDREVPFSFYQSEKKMLTKDDARSAMRSFASKNDVAAMRLIGSKSDATSVLSELQEDDTSKDDPDYVRGNGHYMTESEADEFEMQQRGFEEAEREEELEEERD